MTIALPQTRPYAGLFVVASRISANAVEEIGSIIVKAGYLLTPSSGAETHRMEPDPDPSASALVVSDQGEEAALDDTADPPKGFDVTREADVAPFKPLSDLVVEGFRTDPDDLNAEVRVDGVPWLTRTALSLPPPKPFHLADRARHLFGYQPRSLAPRKDEAGSPPSTNSRPTLLSGIPNYDNRFLNFHRRGDGFTVSGAVSTSFAAGQRVVVRKAGVDALSVTLTHPSLTAIYRTWCGSGPDKPPYWSRVSIGTLRADTLILRPEAGKAEVIWRAIWHWADEPMDTYRAFRVSEGSA